MAWNFYNKEGKLLYDVVAGSVGDADTLDGVDSTGFVRLGAPGLNTGDVDIDGSVTLPVHILAASTLLTGVHRTVLVNSAAAPRTITLPAAPLTGQIYEIRDVGSTGVGNSATNNITIARNGNTIDGVAADLILNQNGRGVVLAWDGFKWVTLADRTISGGAINADTLDTLDSTQFVRSDVDDTVSENLTFSKSFYSPVHNLNDATNPNLLSDLHRTVAADSATNANPVTITLPAVPVVGQWYEIFDAQGTASVDNITIARNGNFIDGAAANLVLTEDNDSVILVAISATEWSVVARRFEPSGPSILNLDDLADVTITAPLEGQMFRYDTPSAEWVNTPLATLDDNGRLHLRSTGLLSGITFGENLGVGDELTVYHAGERTIQIDGRTIQAGTPNDNAMYLENGFLPPGDTYNVTLPTDNTLICKTSAGDLFIVLPNTFNTTSIPVDGDTIVVKDGEGFAGAPSIVQLVAEGVRYRNLPQLTLDSPTGTIASLITTTIEGGVGVDEVQNFQVSGTGTYNINFDGDITTGLTETSNALAVENAINALSPHTNYGHFSVSVTGATAAAGLAVTFDGGATIDGDYVFDLPTPWSSVKVIYKYTAGGGNWLLI